MWILEHWPADWDARELLRDAVAPSYYFVDDKAMLRALHAACCCAPLSRFTASEIYAAFLLAGNHSAAARVYESGLFLLDAPVVLRIVLEESTPSMTENLKEGIIDSVRWLSQRGGSTADLPSLDAVRAHLASIVLLRI